MSTIVHITADYPNAHTQIKTPAVRSLLALVPEHRHIVYSLNRVNGLGGAHIVDTTGNLATILYRAPPYGILLESQLRPIARIVLEDLRSRGLSVDLVHAHKLTIDGIVADDVARALDTPLISSIWGNTDQKVIEAKPLSRRRFAKIAERAGALLPATPWAGAYIEQRLGIDPRKIRIMPIVAGLQPAMRSAEAVNRIVTLFNLDALEGKNVAALIQAVAKLRRSGRPATLDIYGGGSPASVARIAALMRGMEDFVTLRGSLPHREVQSTLARYAAFAMPSRRETYGMVFIEALYAGIPIVYPRGQSIDGFFDDAELGAKCDARSATDIATSLEKVLAGETILKHNIWSLHERGYFKRFESASIAATYRDVIADATSRARSA